MPVSSTVERVNRLVPDIISKPKRTVKRNISEREDIGPQRAVPWVEAREAVKVVRSQRSIMKTVCRFPRAFKILFVNLPILSDHGQSHGVSLLHSGRLSGLNEQIVILIHARKLVHGVTVGANSVQ